MAESSSDEDDDTETEIASSYGAAMGALKSKISKCNRSNKDNVAKSDCQVAIYDETLDTIRGLLSKCKGSDVCRSKIMKTIGRLEVMKTNAETAALQDKPPAPVTIPPDIASAEGLPGAVPGYETMAPGMDPQSMNAGQMDPGVTAVAAAQDPNLQIQLQGQPPQEAPPPEAQMDPNMQQQAPQPIVQQAQPAAAPPPQEEPQQQEQPRVPDPGVPPSEQIVPAGQEQQVAQELYNLLHNYDNRYIL
jgi:hypothetical protein